MIVFNKRELLEREEKNERKKKCSLTLLSITYLKLKQSHIGVDHLKAKCTDMLNGRCFIERLWGEVEIQSKS